MSVGREDSLRPEVTTIWKFPAMEIGGFAPVRRACMDVSAENQVA